MRPHMLALKLFLVVAEVVNATYSEPNNFRPARVVSVHDGDTVTLAIQMGAGMGEEVTLQTPCRLMGIDAPELTNKPAGQDATKHLVELVKEHSYDGTLVVELMGEDKYGRQLGRLWGTKSGIAVNINQQMIKDGQAKEYFGGARSSTPEED